MTLESSALCTRGLPRSTAHESCVIGWRVSLGSGHKGRESHIVAAKEKERADRRRIVARSVKETFTHSFFPSQQQRGCWYYYKCPSRVFYDAHSL